MYGKTSESWELDGNSIRLKLQGSVPVRHPVSQNKIEII